MVPSSKVSVPAMGGDSLAILFNWNSTTHNILNLHDHPELALDFICDSHHLQVTMPTSAAEHAMSWSLPLIIVLQHASCGVVAQTGHCDEKTPDSCLGDVCAVDSDCHSSLICENRICQHQPDMVFFNVTDPIIRNVTVDTRTRNVTFIGTPLDQQQINATLTNEGFEYISIAPANNLNSTHALSRRGNCHVQKWWFIPHGFYCDAALPRHHHFQTYLDVGTANTYVSIMMTVDTNLSMTFRGGVFSPEGTGMSISWDEWVTHTNFLIRVLDYAFPLQLQYPIPIADLGFAVSGTWGHANIGLVLIPSLKFASIGNYTYSIPITADHHSGKVGVGTKSYNERRGNKTTVTIGDLGLSNFQMGSATGLTAEAKLVFGGDVDIIGSPAKLGLELFAAARVMGAVDTGNFKNKCPGRIDFEVNYGFEVGFQWIFSFVRGTVDLFGGPMFPFNLYSICGPKIPTWVTSWPWGKDITVLPPLFR